MGKSKSILVVEDEADLAELLCFNLQREGYSCRKVYDGRSAVEEVRRDRPDLIILDRMLPVRSGDEVAFELKRSPESASIPILMLTAKAEEADELVGFALGVDDYVTKPFSMKLLIARAGAVLRRTRELQASGVNVYEQGPFRLDGSRYEVKVAGKTVTLTTTEFGILRTLMGARGRVLNRGQLIEQVLGANTMVTDRTIDVHIAALRKKVGESAAWIQTIRGVGYAFRAPDETE